MGPIKIKYFFILVVLIFTGATYDEILNDKNKQIEIIKKEIDESKNIIKNSQLEISRLDKIIDSNKTQVNILNDFLKDFENEKYLTPEQISEETKQVITLEEDVGTIQSSFKNKIINLYKHGKNYELELLMSSKTPNEYLRRNEYLQRFSQTRKRELQELKSKRFILEEKKKMLTLSTSSKRVYIDTKRNEKKILEDKISELQISRENTETQINTNQSRIAIKENQLQNVQDFINNFTLNKKDFKSTKYSRINYSSDEFAKLKGTLNIPIDLGLVRNDFGDYVNNSTNTRITNNGIDFNISKGSKVYSAANGTVSLIGETPFFGQIIIISHDNDFRTVYASISDILVNPGDKVRLNQVIARSGETLWGQGIHFEIWQGKNSLNPREWLRFQ